MWESLRDPYLGREIARKALGRLRRGFDGSDEESAEAEAWCRGRALTPSETVKRLFGDGEELLEVKERHPEPLEEARRRCERAPVELGGAANLDLLYTICENQRAVTVLETGVAYGWSTLVILLSLAGRTGARLYSVDLPYLLLRNDDWVGTAVSEDLRPLWELYRMPDRRGIPRALREAGSLDLAHYDSDKTYSGRRWAYERLWSRLRSGGILMSDDVGDNMGFHDFAAEVGVDPLVVQDSSGDKYQGLIRKP